MSSTLVIYATHSEGYFDILMKQANLLNYNVQILGWGTKWLGFYKRTLDLYDYFLSRPDDEIIISIDGYDSFILDDVDTLVEKYYSFNSPIVWSAERNDSLKVMVFKSKYNYTLNGGCFMGQNKYLKMVFKEILNKFGTENYTQDDQKIVNHMNNYCDVFKQYVKPDVDSILFANIMYDSMINQLLNYFNISMSEDVLSHKIVDGKIIDKKTNISPSIISGPANINISHLVKYYYNEAEHSRKYQLFFLYNFRYEAMLILFTIVFVIIIILFYRKIKNV
jgi:hypothetical protein